MAERSPVIELRVVLTADNYDEALAFWRDGLGLPVERTFGEGATRGALLAAGRATVEILSAEVAGEVDRAEAGRSDPAPVRLALEVVDSLAAADRLASAGARKRGGVVETPWGHRNVRMTTPDGLQITLFTVMKP